ncbi:hypothetical protein [Ramlibacter sp.]|uniref:hypothetical protein n=1 Tax=Ramlibacter sp. TaxID=1917967 RepID=UPI002D5923A5|nr:hypothetical protein [Ramlibacter sp.]HYD76178.1 hypothetical protein [Ramlibacter sp.]
MDGVHRTLDRAHAWQLAAFVLLAAAALVAQGQSAQPQEIENAPPHPVPGLVLSDVEPLPAEDRESTGAIVLHESRVRAQRDAFEAAERRTGVTSAIRHNVARVLEEARGWDNLHEAGAGPAPVEGPPAPPSQ